MRNQKMGNYRKINDTVIALQWHGNNFYEIDCQFPDRGLMSRDNDILILHFPSGDQLIRIGDWIIQENRVRYYYRCTDILFKKLFVEYDVIQQLKDKKKEELLLTSIKSSDNLHL